MYDAPLYIKERSATVGGYLFFSSSLPEIKSVSGIPVVLGMETASGL